MSAIKYRIIYKMTKGEHIIAYKIYAGVFVFMVSLALLEEGINAGVIEPADNLPVFTYGDMRWARGKDAEYRLDYALKHSNLKYLQTSLDEVNRMEKVLTFDYLSGDTVIFSVSCNIETGDLLSFECSDNFYMNMLMKTSFDAINFLIDNHMDRDFMNSRNIVTKVKENKGRGGHMAPFLNPTWVRFSDEVNLTFADVAYSHEKAME